MTRHEGVTSDPKVGEATDADGFQVVSNSQSNEELAAELAGLADGAKGKGAAAADADADADAGKGDAEKKGVGGSEGEADAEAAKAKAAGKSKEDGAPDAAAAAAAAADDDASGSTGERDEHGRFTGKKVEKRIAKTVWEREEARRAAAKLQSENEELRQRLEALEAGAKGRGPAGRSDEGAGSRKEKIAKMLEREGAPKIDDFDDFQDWTAAVADFVAEQEVQDARQKFEGEAEQRVLIDRVSRMAGEGEKEYPGQFVEAMTAADKAGARFHPAVLDVILSEPYGHRLAFELVSHPDLFRRVNEQPTERAALREALATLHRLTSASESSNGKGSEAAASVSKAKRPIQPIGSGRVNAGEPNEDEETDEEYRVRMNRQEFEQRRIRR